MRRLKPPDSGKSELEAWLLADHEALTALSGERGQRINCAPINFPAEQIVDPKEKLGAWLKEAGVPYTEAVARRLSELIDLQRLEQLCPSFTMFKRASQNC